MYMDRSHPLAPKKGARAIAPRKKKIVAQKALVKVRFLISLFNIRVDFWGSV